jgi:enoyl-CoA hydratase
MELNRASLETLLLERDGRVAIITVNRPEKRNALNATVREEIVAALDYLRTDQDTRVLVLTGAGDQAFIAGADIDEFAQRTPLEQRAVMSGRVVFEEMADFPKPTIAMINGYALGGGCELALACDIRIAARSAVLGQPEIKLGIIPGGGATQRLPRLIGPGQALRLLYTGELVAAEEAARIGLVDRVCADAELRAQTLQLARTIAAHSPLALQLAKNAVRAALETPLSAGLRYERELFITAFASDDKGEGVSAFLEKRPAAFRGK